MPTQLRPLMLADLPSVMPLECQSHESPWSELAFKGSFAAQHWMQAIFLGDQLLAYAVIAQGLDDWELLNMTSNPASRRQGHCQALLRAGANAACFAGAQRLLLEVRPSNTAALAAYRTFGFTPLAVRKNYYAARTASGREDALIFELNLNTLNAKGGST